MNLVLNYMEAKEHITIPQFFFIENSTCIILKIKYEWHSPVSFFDQMFLNSSRNGFLEIFNIENVKKYMLKLLKWIKVAGIIMPKKIWQGLLLG